VFVNFFCSKVKILRSWLASLWASNTAARAVGSELPPPNSLHAALSVACSFSPSRPWQRQLLTRLAQAAREVQVLRMTIAMDRGHEELAQAAAELCASKLSRASRSMMVLAVSVNPSFSACIWLVIALRIVNQSAP
jgi:hypothetical protein